MRGSAAFRAGIAPGGVLAGPWVRNELWRRARAVPRLDLRFADNKSLVDAVTGQSLISFTRASSGTFVGSDGLLKTATTNEARFDHNPTTGESLGLLVEEQRTNLLLQSNQFDTTWTNTSSSETAAAGTAPDGTNTAWELKDTLDTVATSHIISQQISFVSGTTYTVSVWMKAGTLSQGGINFPSAAFGSVLANRINLSTGAVLASSAGLTTSVTPFPNEWYRITATATATATTSTSPQIRPMNGGISYIGTGTGTVLIWGAQVEAASFPTSYIPTTTAAATRSADVASITGANFSSWYRQDEGTVFADYAERAFNQTHQVVNISNGTTNERIAMAINSSNVLDIGVISGGTDTFTGNTPTLTAQAYRIGFAYKSDSSGVSANGSAVTDDSAVILPTVSQLDIGVRAGGGLQILNSTIRRLTFWPTRLPNATLQQITQP